MQLTTRDVAVALVAVGLLAVPAASAHASNATTPSASEATSDWAGWMAEHHAWMHGSTPGGHGYAPGAGYGPAWTDAADAPGVNATVEEWAAWMAEHSPREDVTADQWAAWMRDRAAAANVTVEEWTARMAERHAWMYERGAGASGYGPTMPHAGYGPGMHGGYGPMMSGRGYGPGMHGGYGPMMPGVGYGAAGPSGAYGPWSGGSDADDQRPGTDVRRPSAPGARGGWFGHGPGC